MGKILVIFGSKSDENVYSKITEILDKENGHYEIRICSAHRTPEELNSILKESRADVVIAGAGLAAHLPGVIASKIIQPIIGVPVSGNYQGLDALLSIMQMPPGIPVLAVGVEKAETAAKMAAKMLKNYDKVYLVGNKEEKAVQKAVDILNDFGVEYTLDEEPEPGSLTIRFVQLDEPALDNEELTIYVPIMPKDDDKAEAALNILKNSTNGLWVGLNRGENAALAAVEIMNLEKKFTDKLHLHRKRHAEKVKQHDAEVKK